VSNQSDQDTDSKIDLDSGYDLSTKQKNLTLTGNEHFSTKEIVTFLVLD
jgi:hypothetical protein